MELVRGLHNIAKAARGCVLTVGNFDGVHLGHQQMIRAVKQRAARAWGSGGGAGVRAELEGVHRSGRRSGAPDALAREIRGARRRSGSIGW